MSASDQRNARRWLFHLPAMQRQIYALAIGGLAAFLLVAFRSQAADSQIHDAAYTLCLARNVQAAQINETRANIGRLILALVPSAPEEARAAMLAGMTSTQQVPAEDCEVWRR